MEEDYYSYTRKLFDRLSNVYDFIEIVLSGTRIEVVDLSGAKEGAKILDVATGTGKQAFEFAKQGYEVVGVDLSKSMLKVAIGNNRYDNVSFILADAAKLPFKDQHFDLCCISLVLHEMPLRIREQVLQEIVRVTRSGGTIMIIDYSTSPTSRLGRYFVRYIVRLFESKYYPEFIHSDLDSLLKRHGIEVTAELSVIYGIFKIFKCNRR
jgi:ubiquinone/menaquinone biosynthesis C-methylase UbiE